MKKYLIILSLVLVPLFGNGQPPITPDKYWTDSIRPSDSALIATDNSVLGYIDSVDFDISLGYLPIRTGATITVGAITTPICCISEWKANFNYDSILYFQLSAQTINSDLSENLPLRITEIATYSSATDVEAYFNVLDLPTNLYLVPDDYATVNVARNAANVGDTIIVKTISQGQFTLSKSLSVYAVGNVSAYSATDYSIEIQQPNIKVSGVNFKSDFIYNVQIVSSQTGTELYNNYINPTSNANLFIGSSSYPSIISNNYFKDGGTRIITAGDSATFTNNIFYSSVNNSPSIVGTQSQYFNYCDFYGTTNYDFFNNTHTSVNFEFIGCKIVMDSSSFYNASGTGCNYLIKSCEITQNDSIFFFLDDRCDFDFLNNSVTLNNDATLLLTEDSSDTITFQDNNITINTNTTDYTRLIYMQYDQVIDSIKNNTVTVPSTAKFRGEVFTVRGTDSLFFTNNILYNNIDDYDSDCDFITVDPNVFDTIRKCYIAENELYQYNGGAHGIRIGAEATSVADNKVQGILIERNKLIGRYSLSDTLNGSCHAIFIGFNSNPIVRYNNVEGYPLAYVHKGDGVNTTGGRFYYNIANNFRQGQLFKGVDKSFAYNNTFRSSVALDEQRGILVFENDLHSGEQSDSCQLINNIISIDEENSVALYVADSSYLGLISNYNILYADSACDYRGDKLTFSEWQGLSYDANSYDTDPNLQDTTQLWPIQPSNAIGKGFDLDVTYQEGLNISSIWPDNLVLRNQASKWTMGVYVVYVPRIVTTNSIIVIGGGGKLLIFNQ